MREEISKLRQFQDIMEYLMGILLTIIVILAICSARLWNYSFVNEFAFYVFYMSLVLMPIAAALHSKATTMIIKLERDGDVHG